jgi:DNA-binding MarR family transcriptional regulator
MARAVTDNKGKPELPGQNGTRAENLLSGPLDKLLGYHLRRAQSATFQHFAAQLSHRDITPGQLGLLVLIACNPGVSQTSLAREVGVERSTLGEFIDRFESRQLVERRQVATDRRIHAIHLTGKGRRFLDRILPEVEAHEREFTRSLSRQEMQTLMHLLKRLAALTQ